MKKEVFNPYLPSWEYVPDGEPRVFGGRVYLYGSHDRFGGPLFCMNDYIALGAYKCLNERGIPIPDRISVCGCDNDVMSGYMFPALSTMSVDKADFGRQCVRSILCQLKGEPGERRIILYASYIPRQSV